jgi:hypothetical protein
MPPPAGENDAVSVPDSGAGLGYGGGYSSGGDGSGGGEAREAAFAPSEGNEGAMWDNPVFARYFEVLAGKYGPARAQMMMRGFARRFGRSFGHGFRSMGTRSTNRRSKTLPMGTPTPPETGSVPTNEGIRKQVGKQLAGKKKGTT